MKSNYLAVAAFMFMSATSNQVNATPILLTDASGYLTGAKSVDVNGGLYDVEFKVGYQYAATALNNLLFDGAGSAAASMALLQQVFVDGPAGNFDSNPAATIMGSVPVFTIFTANIPTGVPVGFYAWNTTYIPDCFGGRGCDIVDVSQVRGGSEAYAFWTPHTPSPAISRSVPEPSTLASISLGLFALGAVQRRRKQA